MNTGMRVGMGSVVLMLGGLLLAGCGSMAQSSGTIDLSGVTQNWDKVLPVAQRFVILAVFNSDAVRDNSTGLVWEKSPQTTEFTWNSPNSARDACTVKTVGGWKGWRLPSVHELASLVDPSVASPGPTLLPGHPFLNVQSASYWSATADADIPEFAWRVNFLNSDVGSALKANPTRVWCVRGGMNADAY